MVDYLLYEQKLFIYTMIICRQFGSMSGVNS